MLGRTLALLLAAVTVVSGLAGGAVAAPTHSATPLAGHAAIAPVPAGAFHSTPTRSVPSDPYGRHALTGPLTRFPHPDPPLQRGAPSSYSGHYYAGTVYNGSNFTSTQLSVKLLIPSDPAATTDFYYVLLSVWDDASSYDQIGIANSGGVFGVAYSTTSYCAGYYYYSPDAFALNPGVDYNFTMSISNGNVFFNVYAPDGTDVWSLEQGTGGTKFVDTAFFTCGGSYPFTAYDYTDYEEVYNTGGPVPPYDFQFTHDLANNSTVTGFGQFYAFPPTDVQVAISGADSTIANEPYNLVFSNGNNTVLTEVPSTAMVVNANLSVQKLYPTTSVSLSTYNLPSNTWGTSIGTMSGAAPFLSATTVTVPAATPIGNYTVGFAASNGSADGADNQLSLYVDVVPHLSVAVTLSPHAVIDLSQSVKITASATGGLGGNSYVWGSVPDGCIASGLSFSCTPTATGTFPVTVTVTAANGEQVQGVATLAVEPDPTVGLSVTPTQGDVGTSILWTAAAIGGTGGFSYAWYGLPTGCNPTGTTTSCSPMAAGTYNVSVLSKDTAGFTATSPTVTVVVAVAPSALITGTRLDADVGQNVSFSATAVGGTGAYTFSWPGLPSGCTPTPVKVTCAFTAAGSYTVSVQATDALGVSSLVARDLIKVTNAPTIQFQGGPASIDVGGTATFGVQVNGGPGGFHYAYLGLPAGCLTVDTASLSCTPTQPGTTTTLAVRLTDANNFTLVSAPRTFTVYAAPSAHLTASPSSPVAGNAVTISVVPSGGAGGFEVLWGNLPGGCNPTISLNLTCTPGGSGTYTITAEVTDRDGGAANASMTFVVREAPALVSSSLLGPIVLVVVAGAAIGAAAYFLRRRSQSRAAELPEEPPSEPAPAESPAPEPPGEGAPPGNG